MARYTILLKDLVARGFEIFDDSWTTFDPGHKAELCSKILRFYWFCEIGQETPDRFKWYINEHLARIMPYYDQLYHSQLLEIKPLFDTYLETEDMDTTERGRLQTVMKRNDLNSLRQMAESLRRLERGTSDLVGKVGYGKNETWEEHTDGRENSSTHMDQHTDQSRETDFAGKDVYEGKKDIVQKDISETTSDGTKSTTINEQMDDTKTIRSSDTPQGTITASGNLSIDAKYLTNYTSDVESRDTDTQQNETVHNGENKTVDTTIGETSSSTTDKTSNERMEGAEDIDRGETFDKTDHRDTDGRSTVGTNTDETQNRVTTGDTKGYSDGTTRERKTTLEAEDLTESGTETTKGKKILKGHSVSQSELLEAYRRTFLNIDEEIVMALRDNFMGVW